jgi:hypothetical protein
VVLVACGYACNLGWTGFPGNRHWDWLSLLVLPVVVATFPLWHELSDGLTPPQKIGACRCDRLRVLVFGGYTLGWRRTGFQGNTFFNRSICSSSRSGCRCS